MYIDYVSSTIFHPKNMIMCVLENSDVQIADDTINFRSARLQHTPIYILSQSASNAAHIEDTM
jgi:hypothetical protein